MSTYTPIVSQVLTSSSSSVTLNNISQSYTDLIVLVNIKGATANIGCNLSFNGDTASSYSLTGIVSVPSTVGSGSYANTASIYATTQYTGGTNEWTSLQYQINGYTNTNTYKSVLSRYARGVWENNAWVGSYRSFNAITSLTFTPIADSFAAGSSFSVFGIVVGSPKAQGGNIVTTDGVNWYHAFTASGTFTPNQSLTADYLVIAGGGGGGGTAATAAGGGAGGYRSATSQSLTAQDYTVIVGAGGVGGGYYGVNGNDSSFNGMTSTGGGAGTGHSQGGSILQGNSGGSGGGSAQWNASGTQAGGLGNTPSTSPSQGNNGGTSSGSGVDRSGSGGGGAGGTGGTASGNSGGTGGAGSNAHSSWASITNTGVSGYYAGGGGGGGDGVGQRAGGSGGGGVGYYYDISTKNGTVSTGSGGGGINQAQGGSGGSGIVIVRYPV